MTMLWGNRIGLRPFTESLTDAEIMCIYRWSKDPAVLRWSGGSSIQLTFGEFAERLRGEQLHPLDNHCALYFFAPGQFNAEWKNNRRVGVFAIDWDELAGELGIVIGELDAWDKHYGREAVVLFCTISMNHRARPDQPLHLCR